MTLPGNPAAQACCGECYPKFSQFLMMTVSPPPLPPNRDVVFLLRFTFHSVILRSFGHQVSGPRQHETEGPNMTNVITEPHHPNTTSQPSQQHDMHLSLVCSRFAMHSTKQPTTQQSITSCSACQHHVGSGVGASNSAWVLWGNLLHRMCKCAGRLAAQKWRCGSRI